MQTDLSKRVSHIIEKDHPEVTMAYLFGSRVEGHLGPLSDYDFALLVERGADAAAVRSSFASALSRELESTRIDVVLLSNAPVELAFAVISQGEIVYERDVATRVKFEARIMGLYFDALPFLRMARQDIIKGDDHAARVQRYRETFGRTQGALGKIGASQRKEPP
jgi:predicted nucleotidyltransferase